MEILFLLNEIESEGERFFFLLGLTGRLARRCAVAVMQGGLVTRPELIELFSNLNRQGFMEIYERVVARKLQIQNGDLRGHVFGHGGIPYLYSFLGPQSHASEVERCSAISLLRAGGVTGREVVRVLTGVLRSLDGLMCDTGESAAYALLNLGEVPSEAIPYLQLIAAREMSGAEFSIFKK